MRDEVKLSFSIGYFFMVYIPGCRFPAKVNERARVSTLVETFAFGYQDTPNSNALHKRETSDEMIRTLPYFSSLALFFPSPDEPFFTSRLERRAGLSMIERRSASPSFLPFPFSRLL